MEFTAEGRKSTLNDIRSKLLHKHEPYLRTKCDAYYTQLTPQECEAKLKELNEYSNNKHLSCDDMREKLKLLERSRHLLVWLDNSTVANHGYLVCLITCLYDRVVFLTDEEYKEKTGRAVNIQKVIEQPELHFISRCGSSDEELLLYTQTRVHCIRKLRENCSLDGIPFYDTMRFCHGDNPMRAFEAGQQKGGHYFCSCCGIHCGMTNEIDHALNQSFISLQERQDHILKGTISKRNSLDLKAKPLKDLKKRELEEELSSRGIYNGTKKGELQDLLTEEMCGKQRVPALLFNNPKASLGDYCLPTYEILPCEPLHDISHHIENVLQEVPAHLTEPESKLLQESTNLCLGNKESKRGCDYRTALVKITGVLHQSNIMTEKALALFDTLVEMQRILYTLEKKRTPALILRYYNQVWQAPLHLV